jgi:cytochrome c oxidase assembly protein subunit 11
MILDGDKRGSDGTAPSFPAPGLQSSVKSGANRRDLAVAAMCGVFVAFMVGMAYAAVPLYSWFCKTTGFGGVPQIATVAPAQISDRKITVRFDANVGAGLPWRFEPERTSIEVRLGEVVTVFYSATNLSKRETGGQAAYNVAPTTVGGYFTKINCFCFTEQHLAPGEKREMAVVFYVDPEPRKGGVADSASPAGAERKI